MKTYRPVNDTLLTILARIALILIFSLLTYLANAQELVFTNPALVSGTAGSDGAVYRFSGVNSKHDVDALIRINGRSSSLVQLVSIDMTNMGHEKAFQPKVTYNNNSTPSGISDWWMEFEISFVKTGTSTAVPVDSFMVTALDIDGNGDKINEWVSFYNCYSYSFEAQTLLQASNLTDLINNLLSVVGKKFTGPTKNYTDIDTSATDVMATNEYKSVNSFRLRTGGHSTGSNSAADRLYSFWFKSFNYQAPVEFRLPLVLQRFDAVYNNGMVSVNWSTGMEKDLSHFVIERSSNGSDYQEVGMLFTEGNTDMRREYSFPDRIGTGHSGVLYYRLRMVDMDGRFQYSPVRLIRIGEAQEQVKLLTYPNPVVNELRVTIPAAWQNQDVSFAIINSNGQVVKQVRNSRAGQTETINVQDITAGVYFVRVTAGSASAIQRIVKSK